MQYSYLVRFSSQIGVGLDPHKAIRKERPRIICYLKGLYFHGGPTTANCYTNYQLAQEAINRVDGIRRETGSVWLGHCWPCEIVSLEQAYLEEGIET